jgi:hypothetical protein
MGLDFQLADDHPDLVAGNAPSEIKLLSLGMTSEELVRRRALERFIVISLPLERFVNNSQERTASIVPHRARGDDRHGGERQQP